MPFRLTLGPSLRSSALGRIMASPPTPTILLEHKLLTNIFLWPIRAIPLTCVRLDSLLGTFWFSTTNCHLETVNLTVIRTRYRTLGSTRKTGNIDEFLGRRFPNTTPSGASEHRSTILSINDYANRGVKSPSPTKLVRAG